jgi:capsular exopolysaccharide synthesis family protein
VLQRWAERFDVLASGPLPPNPSELLASRHMATMLAALRERYDAVLVDSPPLLPVTDAAAVAPATDGAILVCRFRCASQGQVNAAVEHLQSVAAPLLGTVFTIVPSRGPLAYGSYHSYRFEPGVAATPEPAGPPAHRGPGNDSTPVSAPNPAGRAYR